MGNALSLFVTRVDRILDDKYTSEYRWDEQNKKKSHILQN